MTTTVEASTQEQYEAVWPAAMAAADRLSVAAVEYDDEEGRALNLTVAASIVASAMLEANAKPANTDPDHSRRLIEELADAGKALVDAITFDESGTMIAGKYQGGNGGLISRETTVKADHFRRVLAKVGR